MHLFVLDVSIQENVRRLQDPARRGGAKLTDTDILGTIRNSEKLFIPETAMVLDVTNLTAEAAAAIIVQNSEQTHG